MHLLIPPLVVAFLFVVFLNILRPSRAAAILRDAAARLGMPAGRGRITAVSGTLDGHRAVISYRAVDVWVVSITGPEMPDLVVHSVRRPLGKTLSEAPIGSLLRGATHAPLVTGDARFDSEVVVQAKAEQATSLRDPLTRALVREAVGRGLEIAGRTLTLRCGPNAAAIADDVRLLLQVAKRLEQRPPELAPGQLSVAEDPTRGGAVSLVEKRTTR